MSARCSFDMKHLSYWERQPVPVFAALVPVEWPIPKSTPPIYIVDITSYLIENGLPTTTSKRLVSDFDWQPGDQERIRVFLRDRVPYVTAELMFRQGVVADIPTPEPEYVRRSPLPPVSRYREKILRQIRETAAVSIQSMWRRGELGGNNTDFRQTLSRVVKVFETLSNYEIALALALSHHADKEFAEAVEQYGRALELIRDDSNIAQEPSWRTLAKDIQNQVAKAINHEPV